MRNEPRTFWTAVRFRALALLISVIGTFALAQQVPSDPRKSAPEPAATAQPPSSGQPATTEPPPNAGPTADPGQTASDSPAGADKADKADTADTADTDETAPPVSAPDKPAAAKGSPQHFEPTEKVRPDFDVAFPVDI